MTGIRKITGAALLAGAFLALFAGPAQAIITFTQLDENTFTVSHRVKGFGSRGKATKMVYTKAASLCIAAGFTHYHVQDQESQASQQYEAANATLTLRFFQEDGEGRVSCESGSDPEYVADAWEKLEKRGYSPPEPEQEGEGAVPPDPEQEIEQGSCAQGCTIEQIAAMARTGLSDEQIRAACETAAAQSADNPMN